MINHFSACQLGRDLASVKNGTHRVKLMAFDLESGGMFPNDDYKRLIVECVNCGQRVVMEGKFVPQQAVPNLAA